MVIIYPYESLGHADHGWLDARHHFSFASYHNPERMGFGTLRVINDDRIAAGKGFAPHPHKDMEIITYVRQGAITHEDNQGNKGRTVAGDVQVMSAGTGVTHSEYNLEEEDTRIFQIWIEPREKGVAPRWDAREFPKQAANGHLELLVSGRQEDADSDALFIHQDAAIYGGTLAAGSSLEQPVKHGAYVLVSNGEIRLNGQEMKTGDGAEVTGVTGVSIEAVSEAEVLVIDAPR